MPRLLIEDGVDLIKRDSFNVRTRMNGRVELSSPNKLPNPDLRDFDTEGRLRDWTLDAPDRPDGYYLYARRLTEILANGTHRPLRDTVMRGQTVKLPFGRPFYEQRDDLFPGSPIPDANKRARIAGPPEPLRVRVMAKGGAEGYPSGDWFIAYAWITGNNPVHSQAITNAGPAIKVTLAQGQRMEVFLTTPPEGATGVAILMGRTATTMVIQLRVNLRLVSRTSVFLPGPFRQDRRTISALSPNTTSAGTFEQRGVAVRIQSGRIGTLAAMSVALSYKLVTDMGVSASQKMRIVNVPSHKPGHIIRWKPNNPPDIARFWIPEFLGNDGQWYTVINPDNGSTIWPINREAGIYDNTPQRAEPGSGRGWVGDYLPTSSDRTDEDTSALPGPTEPLDEPSVFGSELLKPGKYAWRGTYGVEDEQSAPSPPVTVTLRDSGLAAGLPATGTSDQKMRVFRPFQQKITNARFTEKDADGLDLEWEIPAPPPGTTVSTAQGTLIIDDTSNSLDPATVRLSNPIPINLISLWTLRVVGRASRYTGGAVRVNVQAIRQDASGNWTVLKNFPLLRVDELERREAFVRFGTRGKPRADVWIPTTTTHFRISIHVAAWNGTARNLRVLLSNFALFSGYGPRKKRWPLDLGLYNDREVVTRRTPNGENDEKPYPPGPFCRVVEDPDDPAWQNNPVYLDQANFDDGTVPASFPQVANGGASIDVSRGWAINGQYGVLIEKTDSTAVAASGYLRNTSAANRATFGTRAFFKLVDPWTLAPPHDAATLLQARATPTGGGDALLARIYYTPHGEDLHVEAVNGATTTRITLHRHVPIGTVIRIELFCENVGTINGRVTARLYFGNPGKRQPEVVMQSLDWSGIASSEVRAGVMNVPAGYNFAIMMDNFVVTESGDRDLEPIPGNYAEYWAPENTPPSSTYFMTGMQVPIEPDTDYVFSGYIGTENLDRATWLLKSDIKNENNVTVTENPYLAGGSAGLIGDNQWKRYWFHFRSPLDASYLDFTKNWVGGGLIRGMAFQLDQGVTTPRPFDNTNALSGWTTAAVDTALPGGDPFPSQSMSLPVVWGAADAVVDHPEDNNGTIHTSHTIDFRTGETLAELDSAPWRASLADVVAIDGKKRYLEFRVNLSSTNALFSPELDGVFLDVIRPKPTILREDGSEFHSGTFVRNLPAPSADPNVVEKIYADGSRGSTDMGRGRTPESFNGVTIECFRDSTAREIRKYLSFNKAIIESRGKRYRVKAFGEKPRFAVDRQITGVRRLPNHDGIWLHRADGWNFDIISEVSL